MGIAPNADVPALALTGFGLIFLALAAFAAAAEVAFHQSSVAKAQDLVDDNRRHAQLIRAWMGQKNTCVSAMRSAKVMSQVLFTVCITVALSNLPFAWYWVAAIAVVVTGGSILVTGSLIAVQIGRRQPEGTLVALAPLIRLILATARLSAPLARLRPPAAMTDAELRQEMAEDLREMVDELGENENLDIAAEDRDMLRSVFELGMTLVREVMVPRTDMATMYTDQLATEAITTFVRSGFSRVPVIGHDTDDIRGIVYLKDVVARIHARPEAATQPVHSLMREAKFVPETKYADDLLREMQRDRYHMALVVDEWGGIAGLVTIEDLVEEIVGEVADEHDRSEVAPEEIEPGRWRIPSRLGVTELGELFGIELDDDDVDTAGGLLNKFLDKVADPGEEVVVAGIHLRAEKSQGQDRRMYNLMAWIDPSEEENEL